MSHAPADPSAAWAEALTAAALLAVDPAGLGGVVVRARPGPARDAWLAHLRALLPDAMPVRRMPLHIDDDRLLGGLDLPATLRAGRPVAQRGLLAETDGGLLLLPMAERLTAGTAARLCAVLDRGRVAVERDGLRLESAARLGIVALDEGEAEDETAPSALSDRLALRLDLSGLRPAPAALPDVAAARARLPAVTLPEGVVEALCSAAAALGVRSLRAPLLALRLARCAAALAGRSAVADEDAALAARLVLGPRATRMPQEAEPPEAEAEPDHEPETPPEAPEDDETAEVGTLDEVVLEAVVASLPPDLLARLAQAVERPRTATSAGHGGATRPATGSGRRVGVRPGTPPGGARLALVESLRAAAPWQALRGAEPGRIAVRAEDFRHHRVKRRSESCTVFVVDASGSQALHRLAEAKGAVERLLADCYVRRDRVALVVFRGAGAELALPPTRSLTRARRCLAGLPGGGGTPLACGLEAAETLATALSRRGETPTLVVLTDGRANVARDGTGGRGRAAEEVRAVAARLRLAGHRALLIDTGARPDARARALSDGLGALYLALPRADSEAISRAVRAADAGEARHAVPA